MIKKDYFALISEILKMITAYEENVVTSLTEEKISFHEAKIIETIRQLETIKSNIPTEMIKILNLSKSSLSIALKNLEKKGCITKVTDEVDRRRTFINLTIKGKYICEVYNRIHNDLVFNIFEKLTDLETENLLKITKLVEEAVQKLTKQ